ncbi:MAG: 4'-phosphopantetheinyl transferase superfamily protein [Clostridia bacterium]|nr:4'-phosphopantetheinyl transferase superfamily protein [Clostridia bacterium]
MMSYAKTYYLNFVSLRTEEAIETYIHEVTPERKARIETTKRLETKASLLGAGLLLKAVLKKEYGLSDFSLETNEFGKPFIKDRADIHFNLSHSGDVAVCTVSDTDCGADIESTTAPHETMAVANRFFSRNEYAAMMLSPNPNEAFCRLWTLRESYVKMRGKGFAIGLSTLRCDFHRGVCWIYENHILQDDAFFREIKDVRGYRISVCTKGECEHSVEEIKISDIA